MTGIVKSISAPGISTTKRTGRQLVKEFFVYGLLTLFIGLTLFSDYLASKSSINWLQTVVHEILHACRNPHSQALIVLCLTVYTGAFLFWDRCRGDTLPVLGRRNRSFRTFILLGWKLCPANFWLTAFLLLVLLRYAFTYELTKSAQVPVLLIGIIFGKAVSAWASGHDYSASSAPGPQTQSRRLGRMRNVIFILTTLLAGAALWQPEITSGFQYHGVPRWHGPWIDPNTYGALMGIGFVLAVGMAIAGRQFPGGGLRKKIWAVYFAALAALCGFGLLKSYSRGAWVATFVSLVYLAVRLSQNAFSSFSPSAQPRCSGGSRALWFYKNRAVLSALWLSIALLCFWQFRFTAWYPARRVFSAANINDFSWRNRMTAWHETFHMMADRPFWGFGWGQVVEREKDYRALRLESAAPVHLNDFLMLGASAGVPALFCFAIYLCRAFGMPRAFRMVIAGDGDAQKSEEIDVSDSLTQSERPALLSTMCHASALGLLLSFLLEGGLFKLAVAPLFWVLLELGQSAPPGVWSCTLTVRNSPPEMAHKTTLPLKGSVESWLRPAAWALGGLALIQTMALIAIPFLSVNNLDVAIARRWLVVPAARNDFDFLVSNVDWQGKKLGTLLDHASLSNYNRQLANWNLGDAIYRQYVLMPAIDPESDGRLDWRRALWENFYLRIRQQSSIPVAAQIVLSQMHQQLQINRDRPLSIQEMWRAKTVDPTGFEVMSVAVFRSVGIPAKLDQNHKAEFWNGAQWQVLPRS